MIKLKNSAEGPTSFTESATTYKSRSEPKYENISRLSQIGTSSSSMKPLRRPYDAAGLNSVENLESPLSSVPRVESIHKIKDWRTDDEMDEDVASEVRKVKKRPILSVGSPRRTSAVGAGLNAYGMSNAAMGVQPVSRTNTIKDRADRGDLNDRIRVCLRKRPLNKKELSKKETDVAIVNGRRMIHFYEPKWVV